MNTEEQLKLQAYLDNEVSSSEARQIASWIERDADARALYEELRATKSLLSADNEQPVAVPESRDFYWSKISRAIQTAEREPALQTNARPWWVKLLAPVAGAAALALFVMTSVSTNPHVATGPQIEQSATDGSITFYSAEQRMTVVWIPSNNQQTADVSVSDDQDFE